MAVARAAALGPDPHSYANYDQVVTTLLFPKLEVDFEKRVLRGRCEISLRVVAGDGAKEALLDTKRLRVGRVTDAGGAALAYDVASRHHPHLGECLRVQLPAAKQALGSELTVVVEYETAPNPAGVAFMAAEQTAGGRQPFAFTQFEAILARTCLPCQDTPAVKAPFRIAVAVPEPLVAACSAPPSTRVERRGVPREGWTEYEYRQPIPVQSYLVAFACGALERTQVGPLSFIWSEPEQTAAAKYELEPTGDFLSAGEEICGYPYVWETYDIVVVPRSFAYGGMENPNLTFMNACLIAGDRSLMHVVAHEITHSWSGNLVTNSNWKDFWLNEGFTRYIERQIVGKIYGEDMRHFHHVFGYGELEANVEMLRSSGKDEWTKLRPDLNGVDPDDAFSRVPYEKGCLLLLYLESVVGGLGRMVQWLQKYFQDYAKKSVDAEDMRRHFIAFFGDSAKGIDWDHWFYGVGMPEWKPHGYVGDTVRKEVDRVTALWRDHRGDGAVAGDVKWNAMQSMVLLGNLINDASTVLDTATLRRMDELYQFGASKNCEVLVKWLLLVVKNGALPLVHPDGVLDRFLATHGRGVYVKPLFKRLMELVVRGKGITREEVRAMYEKNKGFYNPVIGTAVEGMVAG